MRLGIYYQKIAETAVYELPQIEPTDVVFARRRLKPDEIERLGLQRGQVVLCTLDEEAPTLGEAGQMIHMPPVGVIASTARRQSPNFEDRRMVVIKEPKFEVPTELRDLAAKAIDQTETTIWFLF